jgi:hypothetical protein
MAVSSGDIIRGVWGAWRLARRDAGGMAMFDISPNGAAKSFYAAVLAFPLYLVMAMLVSGAEWPRLLLFWPLLVETLGFVIGWILMPAALTWILPHLSRSGRLEEGIVTYNWAQLLITVTQFGLVLLFVAGLLPGPLSTVVGLAVALLCYLYEGFVLKTALEVEILVAAGLVAFDAVLSYMLAGWVDLIARSSL